MVAVGAALALCVGVFAGCEGDAFESAAPMKAPRASASGPSQATGVGAKVPGKGTPPPMARGGSAASGELPADHPPVGAGVAPIQAGPIPTDIAPRPRVPASAGAPTQFGKTGPLRWTAPDAWRAVRPASQMRLAEYVVTTAPGQEPASVTVFHFGPGGGGGVEANIDRWVGQIKGPDGNPPTSSRGSKSVNGMTVHTVDATGVYDAGAAMQGAGAKAGQRMLGAIVESPGGLFFFKMVGPKPTVDASVTSWDTLVGSFTPGT